MNNSSEQKQPRSTVAPKRRLGRVHGKTACQHCRKSKVKCMGGIPCERCIRTGRKDTCKLGEPAPRKRHKHAKHHQAQSQVMTVKTNPTNVSNKPNILRNSPVLSVSTNPSTSLPLNQDPLVLDPEPLKLYAAGHDVDLDLASDLDLDLDLPYFSETPMQAKTNATVLQSLGNPQPQASPLTVDVDFQFKTEVRLSAPSPSSPIQEEMPSVVNLVNQHFVAWKTQLAEAHACNTLTYAMKVRFMWFTRYANFALSSISAPQSCTPFALPAYSACKDLLNSIEEFVATNSKLSAVVLPSEVEINSVSGLEMGEAIQKRVFNDFGFGVLLVNLFPVPFLDTTEVWMNRRLRHMMGLNANTMLTGQSFTQMLTAKSWMLLMSLVFDTVRADEATFQCELEVQSPQNTFKFTTSAQIRYKGAVPYQIQLFMQNPSEALPRCDTYFTPIPYDTGFDVKCQDPAGLQDAFLSPDSWF